MRKVVSLLFVALLVVTTAVMFTACEDEASTRPETSTQPETSTTAPIIDPAIGKNGVDDYNGKLMRLVQRDGTWKFKLFSMEYTGEDGDRENLATFNPETDTMAQYMAQFNWNMGDEKLPEGVLSDVSNWESSIGPFGDDGDYNEVAIGFSGDNHGLMIYQTFEIADLEEFLYTYEHLNLYCHYDNTVSIYLNGTLVYRHSIDEAGTPDWNSDYEYLNQYYESVDAYFIGNEAFRELLVEGENTLFAMVKDGWGGRVLVLGLNAAQ